MKRMLLLAMIGSCLWLCGCSSTSSGTGSSDPCGDLAKLCPKCTLPDLKMTCDAALATKDAKSCQDGLNDRDIQTNCK